jgi:hypothetical protein
MRNLSWQRIGSACSASAGSSKQGREGFIFFFFLPTHEPQQPSKQIFEAHHEHRIKHDDEEHPYDEFPLKRHQHHRSH